MANQLGKRYRCEKCGTEVLCVKAGAGGAEGEGEFRCCDQPMVEMQPRVLPSAD